MISPVSPDQTLHWIS